MNYEKSHIYFGGENDSLKEAFTAQAGFQVGALPMKYPGVTLSAKNGIKQITKS